MKQDLMDKIEQIEQLAQIVTKSDTKDFMLETIRDILTICEQARIEQKIEKRLNGHP